MYEVGQTDATDSDFFPVPPSLGRDARKLVSHDRLQSALADVSADILAPLPQRQLRTPTGSVQASSVDNASLSVAVTLCRAEVWGLPPDRDPDEPRHIWGSSANGEGAMTELVLNRASALTLPLVEAARDLGGDGIIRPSLTNLTRSRTRTNVSDWHTGTYLNHATSTQLSM